jgi:hypothetical protein
MTMGKIVCRLPVVVDLIAVLDWGMECGDEMSRKEYIKGDYWAQGEVFGWLLGDAE